MSVMFWGENPTGQWTLNIRTGDVTGVAVVSRVEFQFYGVSRVPEAVANIPEQCHSDCSRGCAREGSNFCDSCVNLRNAYTLECINECPPGYTERSGYCYDATLPTKVCNSPLKNKEGTGFTQAYEAIGCVQAGFTECCTNGNCASAQFHPFNCFCDAVCYNFGDCCYDVANISCSEENGSYNYISTVSPYSKKYFTLSVIETFRYVDLGVTPGVKTHSVDTGGVSQSINVSFPFGSSLEPRVYVGFIILKYWYFMFVLTSGVKKWLLLICG